MLFKPSKAEMDSILQSYATECERYMVRWKMFGDKMDTLLDADLTAMGYTTEQVAYIRSFVIALKNIELKYRNQAPLNTDDPSYFVKFMSRVQVI